MEKGHNMPSKGSPASEIFKILPKRWILLEEWNNPLFTIWAPLPNTETTPDTKKMTYAERVKYSLAGQQGSYLSPTRNDPCEGFSLTPQFKLELYNQRNPNFQKLPKWAAMPDGDIRILLREGISVRLTVDNAVHVYCERYNISIALSSNGISSALIHPNGRVYEYQGCVELATFDGRKSHDFIRYAKISSDGISFTSDKCAQVYSIDKFGTRFSNDTFTDLSKSYSAIVYSIGSRQGAIHIPKAKYILERSKYMWYPNGTEEYSINNFYITQQTCGFFELRRDNDNFLIQINPINGSTKLKTPFLNSYASLGDNYHLFVKYGQPLIHFNGAELKAVYAGHYVKFNENDFFIIS